MDEVTTILNRLRKSAGFSEAQPIRPPYVPNKGSPRNLELALVAAIKIWACDDPKKWSQLRSSVLRMAPPILDAADARGVLMGWVGSCLSRTTAQQELNRLAKRTRVKPRELASKKARIADISFWERTSKQLEPQLPEALIADKNGAGMLRQLMDKVGKEQKN